MDSEHSVTSEFFALSFPLICLWPGQFHAWLADLCEQGFTPEVLSSLSEGLSMWCSESSEEEFQKKLWPAGIAMNQRLSAELWRICGKRVGSLPYVTFFRFGSAHFLKVLDASAIEGSQVGVSVVEGILLGWLLHKETKVKPPILGLPYVM